MAKTRAPLASFSATGKIGGRVDYLSRGTRTIARAHSVPSYPGTPAQESVRDGISRGVFAWRSYLAGTNIVPGWEVSAKRAARYRTAYSQWMSEVPPLLKTTPAASYCTDWWQISGNRILIQLLNMDDGATGDDPSFFRIWVGFDPSRMIHQRSATLSPAGQVNCNDLSPYAPLAHVQIRTDTENRSGYITVPLP